MRRTFGWVVAFAVVGGSAVHATGCSASTLVVVQCVRGSAQLCACSNGATGSQRCADDGTFGACVCDGAPDAGMPADDSGTAPNDASSDIDAWSSSCPAPLVTCGGHCIDPMTDPAFCGATADCAGANAGTACAGTSCSMGRCVWDDCFDALAAGQTADGLYLVDVDGSGPLEPMDAYCDMTTAGGGWTLLYKVGNTVPDISEPWFSMVALGAGTPLPTTLDALPSGTYFEGPDRTTRLAFDRTPARGFIEWRAELLSASGAAIFDVRGSDAQSAIPVIAYGAPGGPGTGGMGQLVVISSSGTLPPAGTVGDDVISPPSCTGTCNDYDAFRTSSGAVTVPLIGDSSISSFGAQYANTTALIWTRPHFGSWP